MHITDLLSTTNQCIVPKEPLSDTGLELFRTIFAQLHSFNQQHLIWPSHISDLDKLIISLDASSEAGRTQLVALARIMVQNFSSALNPLLSHLFDKIIGQLRPSYQTALPHSILHIDDIPLICQLRKKTPSFPIRGIYFRKLYELLRELQTQPQIKTMLITNPVYCSLHTCAIYVRKEKNECKFMIFDSLGIRNEENEINQFIIELIKTIKEELPECKIYLYGNKRQFDEQTCFIFTLNDCFKFSPNAEDAIMSKPMMTIETLPESGWNKLQGAEKKEIYVFHYLPPEMMSLTQSFSLIEKYNKTYLERLRIDRFAFKSLILRKENSQTTEIEKVINLHAEYKYSQWLLRILEHFN